MIDLAPKPSTSRKKNGTMEDSLDEVQALNTALCFLCLINADYREVEQFVTRYPESLLFEDTQPEQSARFVVEEQMRHCQCFIPECNENRRKILSVLKRGFEYYRGFMMINTSDDELFCGEDSCFGNWHFYSKQLRGIERDVREMKMQDMAIRNRIIEATVDVRTCQFKLEGVSKEQTLKRSPLARLACGRSQDFYARRSALEYQLGMATLNMSSLEKEQAVIDQEKLAARRLQLALLKNIFSGCRRHVCEASKKELK